MCDHGCACDNLLQKVPSIHCTAQAQTNKSCITDAYENNCHNLRHICIIHTGPVVTITDYNQADLQTLGRFSEIENLESRKVTV